MAFDHEARCRYAPFIYYDEDGFNIFRCPNAKTWRSLARHCPLEYILMFLLRQDTRP